MKKEKKDYQ